MLSLLLLLPLLSLSVLSSWLLLLLLLLLLYWCCWRCRCCCYTPRSLNIPSLPRRRARGQTQKEQKRVNTDYTTRNHNLFEVGTFTGEAPHKAERTTFLGGNADSRERAVQHTRTSPQQGHAKQECPETAGTNEEC